MPLNFLTVSNGLTWADVEREKRRPLETVIGIPAGSDTGLRPRCELDEGKRTTPEYLDIAHKMLLNTLNAQETAALKGRNH